MLYMITNNAYFYTFKCKKKKLNFKEDESIGIQKEAQSCQKLLH